jgi:hypothetical protein
MTNACSVRYILFFILSFILEVGSDVCPLSLNYDLTLSMICLPMHSISNHVYTKARCIRLAFLREL